MANSNNSQHPKKLVVGLTGNPNVGKSTVFNALTGLKQHTGNWPGKTVTSAIGEYTYNDHDYEIYDLPGTYSLISHSQEEECARDFVCFEHFDCIVVVCDAVCLERNLNLVLQTLEITNKVVVVVNLMDEAKKKGINIDLLKLEQILGVPVVGTSARSSVGLPEMLAAIENKIFSKPNSNYSIVSYSKEIEEAINLLEDTLKERLTTKYNYHWLALKLLDNDTSLQSSMNHYFDKSLLEDSVISSKLSEIKKQLLSHDIVVNDLKDLVVATIVNKASKIAQEVLTFNCQDYNKRDKIIDYFITNKWIGIPFMLCLLMIVFWLTITGANYPSSILFEFFSFIEVHLTNLFAIIHAPVWLHGLLILGVYRTLTWVVAVMLPPMAIFFPLFTLLEDLGLLPRIAFNLDHCFKKCSACGKQALTMCMGFGCNAAGVVGCRIIDSPRERLIAILTNSFVPCNGRFPTIIAIITMFFAFSSSDINNSFMSVFILTCTIVLGIIMTFIVSKFLSKTFLKGLPSSFTLELPPYRRPQIGKVIIHSLLDRTLYVLGRAVVIAAPAGAIIWLLANIQIGNSSILLHCTNFLNPIAKFIGLDGAILMAFILGFPANEIVVPLIIMIYMSGGSLLQFTSLLELKNLFITHGWTALTAINMIVFSLMHWPCSTTCLTIKRETGSFKWTLLAFLLPTVIGIIICIMITTIAHFLGFY
ncbi:MAG: ferrous iron transport protein B [Bacilli bacterium]